MLISIICPVYNEEESIEIFVNAISTIFLKIEENFEIIFINDGSTDNSLYILLELRKKYKNIKIIEFSRNFGKEFALTAGLDYTQGDAIIPIDVDLQDPPELIVDFIKHWKGGSEVVLAKRVNRQEDDIFKRITSTLFYKLHNKISDVKIPENVGDYRLMSKKVVEKIKLLPENQRFMKGIFAWVGFSATYVEYTRTKRIAGTSKFNGWKLWNFALDGITSFSTFPLKVWTYIGFTTSFLSFLYGSFIILNSLIFGIDTPGYASLIVVILFMGGLQLIGIGVLGEYLGRIFMETKKRPSYIIKETYGI